MESLVVGKPALGVHGRVEGCLRTEHWLAREPGTDEPLQLTRHENVLPELKKASLKNGDGKSGLQSAPAWQRRRAALPGAEQKYG